MNIKYKGEIEELNKKMKDITTKISKTTNDKASLEEKKSDSGKQMMSPETYSQISNEIS